MVEPEPFQEGMRRHARLELLKFGFQLVRTQIGVHSLQITLFWPIDFPFLGKDSAFLALVLGGKGLLTSRGKSRSPREILGASFNGIPACAGPPPPAAPGRAFSGKYSSRKCGQFRCRYRVCFQSLCR